MAALQIRLLWCLSKGSYVIDPEGNLYKCIALAGEESTKVGMLSPGGEITYNWDKLLPWLVWEPFDDPRCLSCPVLPLCFGGCLANRFYAGYHAGGMAFPCPEVRDDLTHRLQWKFNASDATKERR